MRGAVLSVFENRNFELADLPITFRPRTDLAILNFIANHIIQTGRVDRGFVERHVNFRVGNTDIGCGLRPDDPRQMGAINADAAGGSWEIGFEDYRAFVADYTLDSVSALSGVRAKDLLALAELYADPERKVLSLGTMGFNQHTRGTWANHLAYNRHPPTGKISEPGNSPFSLTGQPSACGTAREVGTFAHRLPAGTIPAKFGYHAVPQNRMLHDGKLNAYWVMCNNNMQAAANMNGETFPGYRNPDSFIVVSDPYPTVTAMAADLIPPTAMWVEKEGAYGNAERRTQFWRQHVSAPDGAKSDLWRIMELAKRFRVEEVWPEALVDAMPATRGKTLYDVLYANGQVGRYPLDETQDGFANDEAAHFGYCVQKGLFEEYRRFDLGKSHDLAPFDTCHAARGLRWPVIDGEETRWRSCTAPFPTRSCSCTGTMRASAA